MKPESVLLSALLLAGVVFLAPKDAPAMGLGQQRMIGEPAQPIDLKTIEGKRVELSELRGKFVVIHFAASW